MPKYTYHKIRETIDGLGNPIAVYNGAVEIELPNDRYAEIWALGCAVTDGYRNVFMSPQWVPFAGLGDTVSYRKCLWDDKDDVDQEHATPIGELVTAEEPTKPAMPSSWPEFAIESLNDLIAGAQDAIERLKAGKYTDTTRMALAFGRSLRHIGRASAERDLSPSSR
jgi:hypothetical protein